MGFGSFIKKVLDPADLIGGLSGDTGGKAAEEAAEIFNQEIIRQFEQSQANLRPFLEAAQRQLPGIERQLSVGGLYETLGALEPQVESLLAPLSARSTEAAQERLARAGLTGMDSAAAEAGQLDPSIATQLALGAESDLFGRRVGLAGIGEGVGGALSELGQRTGGQIAQSNLQAAQMAQQAQAQGQQNVLGIAGLVSSFFSDERLKKNVEQIGEYKGLRIIRWDWKDYVPEEWRDITVGFSAQDILESYPQFVHSKEGFLAIDKPGLIEHLEAA